MINTLDQNYGDGKIGLVYYDDNSPLVKLIDEKYSDKFIKKKGTSAQGLEGQYYIVDLQGASGDKIKQQKDLYTGITRAQQGAIIFGKNELIKCF
jgi:DNA helicase IV